LNSEVPYTFTEIFFNFIEEPETNYSMARLRQTNADDYLKKSQRKPGSYKFNSANQNSNYSMVQSREGMVFANMENSKQRHLKIMGRAIWGSCYFLDIYIITSKEK